MGERDPDFFKLHYRQWRRRMHKARVPYDMQGALLAVVIETHQMGGPPADDDYVLAGIFMTSPRKARAIMEKMKAVGLVRVEDGLVIDKTAIEDAAERAQLRAARAEAGRLGGLKSGQARQNAAKQNPRKSTEASHDRTAQESVVRRDGDNLGAPSGGFASGKPLKSHETAEANRSTCPNKSREEERGKKEKPTASPKKGTRLPPDWALPKEWGEWALGEGMSVEAIRAEAEKFRDYWHSVPGQRGVKLDWLATWRNWCRKAMERKPQQRTRADDRFARLVSRFEDEPDPEGRSTSEEEVAGDQGEDPPRSLLPPRAVGGG